MKRSHKNDLLNAIPLLLIFGCQIFSSGSNLVQENLQPDDLQPSSPAPSPHTPTYPIVTSTVTPVLEITSTPTFPTEPLGCLPPPDDLTRIEINGMLINRRTYAMLQHAASLYHSPKIDFLGLSITQGSYVDGEPLSFGTHAGGGAVDISVISLERWEVLYDEIEPLVQVLRIAGFAAWLREYDELAPGSPIHIHAVAIGDPELSTPAQEQLTGAYGYFRGFNGLPQLDGIPIADSHGGPLICHWMLEMGYADLRED